MLTKLVGIFLGITVLVGLGGVLWWLSQNQFNTSTLSPVAPDYEQPKPLLAYTFEALREYQPQASSIEIQGIISPEDDFTAYLFSYTTQDKTVSGQINLPNGYQDKKLPVIIMLRGFVDPSIYETGIGTRNAAAVFARNGYITVAPDFLGYGDSDDPDADSFAARVKRPVTVLDLIASVKELDYVDTENIFMWGHSNGGQIAISVLEITSAQYPTTLWAPVTKGFPYSILYYMDEYDDQGRELRQALSIFESLYNADEFSIHRYVDQLAAPIQLHQGGADDAVPLEWSTEFVAAVREASQSADINYFTYPSADHNLRPDWNTVVERDLVFFQEHLR